MPTYARIFEARLIGSLHGQETVNVLHFGSDETPADDAALAAILADLALNIITCAIDQLKGGVTSDFTIVRCETKQLFPTPSDPQVSAAPAATVGLGGTTNVSFAAVLVNIRTGGGGRRGRGRIFLPPPGDSAMTNSVFSDGSTTAFYTGFLTCLMGKYVGGSKTENQTLGVFSRKAVATGTAALAALRPAISLEINQRISCMRSRKVGHGV